VLAAIAHAEPIKKWRTPDGQLHFGDHAPAGSVLEGVVADGAAAEDAPSNPPCGGTNLSHAERTACNQLAAMLAETNEEQQKQDREQQLLEEQARLKATLREQNRLLDEQRQEIEAARRQQEERDQRDAEQCPIWVNASMVGYGPCDVRKW
jgi:hypothetical protein